MDQIPKIQDYLSGKGLRAKRESRGELQYDCFFCDPPDKKGHLYVNAESGLYHCKKCDARGNLVTLMQHFGDRVQSDSMLNSRDYHTLTVAATVLHELLPQKIRRYLNERGINDDSIDRFQIGYASDQFLKQAEKGGLSSEDLNKAGLLKKNGSPFFLNVITIPYRSSGRVTLIRARSDPEAVRKIYFPLPDYELQLFNSDVLRNSKETVLTEGEFDCIIANQNGFAAVGVPGANAFKEGWNAFFNDLDFVYVCFDSDEAGRKGAKRIAHILGEKARIVNLPEGQDVTEFFTSDRTTKDFQHLLDDSQSFLDMEITRITSLPKHQHHTQLRKVFPYIATLDPVDRQVYRDRLKRELKLPVNAFDEAVKQANATVEKGMQVSSEDVTMEEPTPEELNAAKELLKSDDLIKTFMKETEKLGCVGEDNNKMLIYLALTSRILDDPISLIVKGESSSGKSYLVNTVSRFFPEDEILQFTALSAKALFHRKQSLAHKGLIIFERRGAEESDYPIRTLQSEKKIVFGTVVKDPETKDWVEQDIKVDGPIAYIETTTHAHIHPENETRCFEIYTDESQDQTRRIIAVNQRKYKPGNHEHVNLQFWRVAQKLLESYRVEIPYVDLIRFPTESVRTRRDHVRFLSLIEASAILHQYQRIRKEVNGESVLVADIEDYVIAYELAIAVLHQTIKSISPTCEEMMSAIYRYLLERSDNQKGIQNQSFTRRDIETYLGWNRSKTEKHLGQAERAALLDVEKPGSGKANIYKFIKLPDSNMNALIHPNELKEMFANCRETTNLLEAARIQRKQVNPLEAKEISQATQVAKVKEEVKENSVIQTDLNLSRLGQVSDTQ